MADRIDIENLGKKIELILRSEKGALNSHYDLLECLDISKDYYSRIKSGSRILTEDKFVSICHALEIEQKYWFLPLFEFGKFLGLSRKQISNIAKISLPGIDFSSRIKDKQMVEQIFDTIEGIWESYYFSVSNMKEKTICKDILCIDRVNEDGFIECRILETDMCYKGVCFPIKSQLMFILEKDVIFNEIITYCTNLPERSPPRLYGVLLCLSGGVHEIYTHPAASKVGFRFIGNEKTLKSKYPQFTMKEIEDKIKQEFCGYLRPSETDDEELKILFQQISNVVEKNEIPSAITMSGQIYSKKGKVEVDPKSRTIVF